MDGCVSLNVLECTWMSIPRNSHFIRGMLTFIRTGILHFSNVTRCETSSSCSELTFLLDHYLPLITPTWHQDWQSREAQWQAWRWWRGRSRWRSQLLSLLAVSGPSAPSYKCPSAWCRTPLLLYYLKKRSTQEDASLIYVTIFSTQISWDEEGQPTSSC